MASQTGNHAEGSGQEISSHEPLLSDLPSKRLLGEGLAGNGYETEREGKRCARTEFVGVPSSIFREEAADLVALEDHKNVVKTYGWTIDKRSCSLVLQFMDDDLLGLLQMRKEYKRNLTDIGSLIRYDPSHLRAFDLEEAMNVIMEISESMMQLHVKGIAHGDLKTRNILVNHISDLGDTNSWSVKVADFGLVRTKRKSMFFVSRQARKLDMVQWKAPDYLSRLISLGKLEDNDETSSESDSNSEENTTKRPHVNTHLLRSNDAFAANVYSFALTCSQILTGEDPYPKSNWEDLVDKILRFGLRPSLHLPASPPALNKPLQSCWDREPSRRPTFSNFQQELQVLFAFLQGRRHWHDPNRDCQLPLVHARTGKRGQVVWTKPVGWKVAEEGSGLKEGGFERGVSDEAGLEEGGLGEAGLEEGGSEQGGLQQGGSEQGGLEQGGSEEGRHCGLKEVKEADSEEGDLDNRGQSIRIGVRRFSARPAASPVLLRHGLRSPRGLGPFKKNISEVPQIRGGRPRKPRNINEEYAGAGHLPKFGDWYSATLGKQITPSWAASKERQAGLPVDLGSTPKRKPWCPCCN